MGVLGGLALFLFGMSQMTGALKQVAGDGMRTLLAKLTKNRFLGAVTGAVVTAICQSSSVTTVLLVGFITAELMTLQQAIGVILGANIGSTVTAQLIAFQITELALPMITIGFGMNFLSQREKLRQIGEMIMGLGLVFYGMALMSEATFPLRDYQPFIDTMKQMDHVVLAIVVSAVITGIIQSSARDHRHRDRPGGSGVHFSGSRHRAGDGRQHRHLRVCHLCRPGKTGDSQTGGGCARDVQCHWRVDLDSVRTAAGRVREGNLAFLSQSGRHLPGWLPKRPDRLPNAHTAFNIFNTLVFIWFTGLFARLVQWLIPDRPATATITVRPKYLDKEYLQTPSLALDRLRMEVAHMGEHVVHMIQEAPRAVTAGTRADLQRVCDMDDAVDTLYAAMVGYIRKLGSSELSESESRQLQDLLVITDNLESVGDLIETNLVAQGMRRIEQNLTFSDQTISVLTPLYEAVGESLRDALQAVVDCDGDQAAKVIARKPEIQRLAEHSTAHLAQRLLSNAPNRMEVFRVESDVIGQLSRIYYFAKRIAKVVAADAARSSDELETAWTSAFPGTRRSGTLRARWPGRVTSLRTVATAFAWGDSVCLGRQRLPAETAFACGDGVCLERRRSPGETLSAGTPKTTQS